jgi:hypothetical protein
MRYAILVRMGEAGLQKGSLLTRHIIRPGFVRNGHCPFLIQSSASLISAWFAKSLRSILRTSLNCRIANVASRWRTFASTGAHYGVASARRWQPFSARPGTMRRNRSLRFAVGVSTCHAARFSGERRAERCCVTCWAAARLAVLEPLAAEELGAENIVVVPRRDRRPVI